MAERQVKSRKRVADHGEVFTAEREVNAMLDMVKPETERIDERFGETVHAKSGVISLKSYLGKQRLPCWPSSDSDTGFVLLSQRPGLSCPRIRRRPLIADKVAAPCSVEYCRRRTPDDSKASSHREIGAL